LQIHESFDCLEAAGLSVFKSKATFYDPFRLHQTFDFDSPGEYEVKYSPAGAA